MPRHGTVENCTPLAFPKGRARRRWYANLHPPLSSRRSFLLAWRAYVRRFLSSPVSMFVSETPGEMLSRSLLAKWRGGFACALLYGGDGQHESDRARRKARPFPLLDTSVQP